MSLALQAVTLTAAVAARYLTRLTITKIKEERMSARDPILLVSYFTLDYLLHYLLNYSRTLDSRPENILELCAVPF